MHQILRLNTTPTVYIAFSCSNISAQDPSHGSGTCPDPTPGNGTLVPVGSEILPNGTYSVGTGAFLQCNEGFVGTGIHSQSTFLTRCIEPGLWTHNIRCIPQDEGK